MKPQEYIEAIKNGSMDEKLKAVYVNADAVEEQKPRYVKLLNEFKYHTFPGIYKKDSAFARWNDQSIMVVEIPSPHDESATESLFTSEIVNLFRLNGPTDSKYVELMQKFIRNEPLTIYDIPLDLNEELMKLDANEEVFFFTPILMYIIQVVVNDFLKEKK